MLLSKTLPSLLVAGALVAPTTLIPQTARAGQGDAALGLLAIAATAAVIANGQAQAQTAMPSPQVLRVHDREARREYRREMRREFRREHRHRHWEERWARERAWRRAEAHRREMERRRQIARERALRHQAEFYRRYGWTWPGYGWGPAWH